MTKKGSGATFNFKGNVEVKGDMLGGDKVIHNYGDNIVNIQTPPQFISALQDLRGEITALKEEAGISPAQKANWKLLKRKSSKLSRKRKKMPPMAKKSARPWMMPKRQWILSRAQLPPRWD